MIPNPQEEEKKESPIEINQVIQDSCMLLHPLRYKIISLLNQFPELYTEEISTKAGIKRKTITFHLDILTKNGFIIGEYKMSQSAELKGRTINAFKLLPKVKETFGKLKELLQKW